MYIKSQFFSKQRKKSAQYYGGWGRLSKLLFYVCISLTYYFSFFLSCCFLLLFHQKKLSIEFFRCGSIHIFYWLIEVFSGEIILYLNIIWLIPDKVQIEAFYSFRLFRVHVMWMKKIIFFGGRSRTLKNEHWKSMSFFLFSYIIFSVFIYCETWNAFLSEICRAFACICEIFLEIFGLGEKVRFIIDGN